MRFTVLKIEIEIFMFLEQLSYCMSYSTLKVDADSYHKFDTVSTFVGEPIYNKEIMIYHTTNDSVTDINALKISGKRSSLLKENGEVEKCSVECILDWSSPYEIQLYIIQYKGSYYVVSLGWINNMFDIDNSTTAKIHIDNTPVVIVARRVENGNWEFEMILDNLAHDSYEKHNVCSDISKYFSPISELVQIGFKDSMPESISLEYG